jgi:microcystin-dependent protein
MSTPYLGQLLLCSWNFPAKGWAFCNGQLLAIQQNTALFSLLGTTYGGNGVNTFGLPGLQGRTPVAFSQGIALGQAAGEPNHTLTITEVPAHTHTLSAVGGASSTRPSGALLASGGGAVYTGAANLAAMNPATIGSTGGSQPHENMQPYLVMNWCIALVGIFPTRN